MILSALVIPIIMIVNFKLLRHLGVAYGVPDHEFTSYMPIYNFMFVWAGGIVGSLLILPARALIRRGYKKNPKSSL